MSNQAFSPLGNAVVVAATVANVSSALPGSGGDAIRVVNKSGNAVSFRVGTGAQTAVLTDNTVANGSTEVFAIPGPAANIDTVGCILEAGAAGGSVIFQRGSGM